MPKKMTISIDDDVYAGLLFKVGKRKMSKFLSDIARPYVVNDGLEAGYKAMAADKAREADALEWCNALIEDVSR